MTTTITTVPLTKLRFGHEFPGNSLNSRVVGRDAEIEQLARSIQEEDLLLPLIVAKSSETGSAGDVYYVIDGNRRLAALRTLVKDRPVEVKIVSKVSEAGALRLSYAANGHVPLHPADRAEFFAKQSKELSADQIAEKFGMTLRTVQQSIALGGTLAPEILNLWRTGEMPRAFIEIFTLAASQELQLTTLEWLKTQWKWQDGREQTLTELRRKLTKGKEPEMKRLLGFVGIEGFRGAGGVVTEDFFGTGGVVQDMKLLHKLAKTKMDELLEQAKSDGWAWAEGRMKENFMHHGYGEMRSKPSYTAAESSRIAAIKKRIDSLQDSDDPTDAEIQEQDDLEAEQSAIDTAAKARGFTIQQKAKGGIIISLTKTGSISYTPGLIRKDEPKAEKKEQPRAPRQPEERATSWEAERHLEECVDEALYGLLCDHPKDIFALFLAAGARNAYNDPFQTDCIGSMGNEKPSKQPVDKLYQSFLKLSSDEMINAAARHLASGVKTNDDGWVEPFIMTIIGEVELQNAVATKFDPKKYFTGASKRFLLGVMAETLGEDVRAAGEKTGDKKVCEEVIAAVKKTGWLPPALRTSKYVAPVPPKASVTAIEPKPKKATTTKKVAPKRKAA